MTLDETIHALQRLRDDRFSGSVMITFERGGSLRVVIEGTSEADAPAERVDG